MSDKIERRTDIGALAERAPDTVREFLAFVVGEETFAFPLASVREILKPPPITPVPRAPSEIAGVISVRGKVVTVVDLRRTNVDSLASKHTRVLLTVIHEELMGIMVDRVLQVYRFLPEEMELVTGVGSERSEYVLGVGRPGARAADSELTEHDIVVLIDPAAFFSGTKGNKAWGVRG